MGVEGLNTIIKRTPKEALRKYRRVVIDGSNLIFAKLASNVSHLRDIFRIPEWEAIDKNLLYQTKYIIDNATRDIIGFIDRCFRTYCPDEVYLVMDPKTTPSYRVNADMLFENESETEEGRVMTSGTLRDNQYLTAIMTPEEIADTFTVEYSIKEEEQEKRKLASDKTKQTETELSKLQTLNIEPDYVPIVSMIYKQSYHYRNVSEMLKLSRLVLLNVEEYFVGKNVYVVDAKDEADLVIKNIVKNNIGTRVQITFESDGGDVPEEVMNNATVVSSMRAPVGRSARDVMMDELNSFFMSSDSGNGKSSGGSPDGGNVGSPTGSPDVDTGSPTDNVDALACGDVPVTPLPAATPTTPPTPPAKVIKLMPPLENPMLDYTLVVSADTDYCVLFSDSPTVHCRTLADDFVYSPYKCWKAFLGRAYSYDAVIRAAALFGNDYTTKLKVVSAVNHPDDMKMLFNVGDKWCMTDIKRLSAMKTLYKVASGMVSEFTANYDTDAPTPLGFVDYVIHEWDIKYFRKYFLSTIIYKNWNEYNSCTIRKASNFKVLRTRYLYRLFSHIRTVFYALYDWENTSALFSDSETFLQTISEQVYATDVDLLTAYTKIDIDGAGVANTDAGSFL